MGNYIILACGWAIYFLHHSLFASDKCKLWFRNNVPVLFKHYRLIYTTFSLLGLLLLLFVNALDTQALFNRSLTTKYTSLLLAGFGVIIIRMAFKQYKLKSFLGLTHEQENFTEDGILKHVRHPIYSAIILIAAGFFLYTATLASLLTLLCVLAYIPIGIILEEKKLIRLYGHAYENYKKRVPALIPLKLKFW